MNRFIVLLSIIGWGWFNQSLLISGIILVPILIGFSSHWRWQFTTRQFFRVGDLTMVLIVLTLIYSLWVKTEPKAVFFILKWLPVFFAIILWAQLLSQQNQLPLATLFYSLRHRQSTVTFDFNIPYAGLCWLSAGTANVLSPYYFILVSVQIVLVLWSIRSKQESFSRWGVSIGLLFGLAFWGQQQLQLLQQLFERQIIEWLSDWQTDPFKVKTAIGDIGQLKLSDRIEFRVKARHPLLLHQISYDRYLGQSWYASQRYFTPTFLTSTQRLDDKQQITVYQQFNSATILALPLGTVAIKGLEDGILKSTGLGAVKLTQVPQFARYQVFFTGKQSATISHFDLEVPDIHRPWIKFIHQKLKLEHQSAAIIAANIKAYFQTHYRYRLFLGHESDTNQALQNFILNSKSGHCEYFAVSTVLLLRSYGIPARLANGYSVHEYNTHQQLYLVRRRHAHAWAIAYIDGRWRNIDATPSQWATLEAMNADFLQSIYDELARLYFNYQMWWRNQHTPSDTNTAWLKWGGITALLAYLVWHLFLTRQSKMSNASSKIKPLFRRDKGLDSPFYQIDHLLHSTAQARLSQETPKKWAERIDDKALADIVRLHYRYRFDPQAMLTEQRQFLQQQVDKIIQTYRMSH